MRFGGIATHNNFACSGSRSARSGVMLQRCRECNVGADCARGVHLNGTLRASRRWRRPSGRGRQGRRFPEGRGPRGVGVPSMARAPRTTAATNLRSQGRPCSPVSTPPSAIAENATVSTAGETLPDGSRTWDLTGASRIRTSSSGRSTTAGACTRRRSPPLVRFPAHQYLSLLGVFQATESALLLQGVVSPPAALTETELTYKPAVTTLQFSASCRSDVATAPP